MHVDPYEKCSARASCPQECMYPDLNCPGGVDEDGCPVADSCQWSSPNCPNTWCPVFCTEDEMLCT